MADSEKFPASRDCLRAWRRRSCRNHFLTSLPVRSLRRQTSPARLGLAKGVDTSVTLAAIRWARPFAKEWRDPPRCPGTQPSKEVSNCFRRSANRVVEQLEEQGVGSGGSHDSSSWAHGILWGNGQERSGESFKGIAKSTCNVACSAKGLLMEKPFISRRASGDNHIISRSCLPLEVGMGVQPKNSAACCWALCQPWLRHWSKTGESWDPILKSPIMMRGPLWPVRISLERKSRIHWFRAGAAGKVGPRGYP